MAKKGGKSSGHISNGVHSNTSRKLTNAMRREYMASGDRIMNQLLAFRRGRNVMLTMENPNKTETNKRFIRVAAKHVWKT